MVWEPDGSLFHLHPDVGLLRGVARGREVVVVRARVGVAVGACVTRPPVGGRIHGASGVVASLDTFFRA